MDDHTIQFKIFEKDADEPYYWLEWRRVKSDDFNHLIEVIKDLAGKPMNRSGD